MRESGTYVGFFEWLIWSVIEDVSVLMLIGSNLLDVAALFGHSLGIVDLDSVRPVHYPIACQISEEGLFPARYETTDKGGRAFGSAELSVLLVLRCSLALLVSFLVSGRSVRPRAFFEKVSPVFIATTTYRVFRCTAHRK